MLPCIKDVPESLTHNVRGQSRVPNCTLPLVHFTAALQCGRLIVWCANLNRVVFSQITRCRFALFEPHLLLLLLLLFYCYFFFDTDLQKDGEYSTEDSLSHLTHTTVLILLISQIS